MVGVAEPDTRSFAVIGKNIPRVDGVPKVTGSAQFSPDLSLPGMLHGAVLHSPFAHARIVSIDTSAAESFPGVIAVATAQDLPEQFAGSALMDQPALARDRVRYVGEPVAAVAAADRNIARQAAALIKVEYEELPAVFSGVEAMEQDAPIIHPRLLEYDRFDWVHPIPNSNVCHHFKIRKGDVEQGFAESDHVFEDTYYAHAQLHAPLEPHAALAWLDQNNRVVFASSTTRLHPMRFETARLLGRPAANVRGIASYCGGSFGAKGSDLPIVIACVLAEKSRRPVKVVFTREESVSAIRRHDCTVTLKTGVKNDGTIVARSIKLVWDGGAYSITGPNISINAGASSPGPYRVPNVRVDSYSVYTNTSPAGSFRGFGTPQVTWACESQMDEIAEKLGMDPLELRLKNAHVEFDQSPTGEVLRGVGVKETLIAATDEIGWGKIQPGKDRGIGFATGHKVSNSNSSTVAYVSLQRDGSVQLFESVMDSGPGEDTTLSQIAAEELGLPFESISLLRPDTDSTPHDFGTVSSRVTFCAGEAVRRAAAEAKAQLLGQAAKMLEVDVEDIEWKDGKASVTGAPSGPSLTAADLAAQYFFDTGGPVFGKGTFKVFGEPPDPETGQTPRLAQFWMYVTQAAEVEVDRETGEVKVLRLVGANDSGRTINPVHAESQIHGGLVQGLGYALSEQMVWDENGRFVTNDFRSYGAPTALDPPPMAAALVEVPHPEGPFGAKGMAETGLIPTAPAIANAIYRAVGVRIKELPITPERVLEALRRKEAEEATA